ncbi:flagellin [Halomonas sp. C05BenzN]|uniref:flagellin N-terminal helical domain-containing protein n=1 Tax=Halomonas sp. C05BenzN TaxID=3411041 RepID=UPI003B93B482
MSVINTNITSMIGQANLQKSQNALQTSMERLSSGLRINSAKDDAAGQAIANRMSAQITGLAQAQRNANDGISLAQTAEGSLNQVNDNLQRIRELSVQAQNETNSSDDLQSIQDEINQRLEEIDRISAETSFNGVKVLASDQGLKIQVGANDGEQISVNLKEITSSTLSLSNFDIRNESLDTSALEATPTTEAVASTLNIEEVKYNADNDPGSSFEIWRNDADPTQLVIVNTATDEGWNATYDQETGEIYLNTDDGPNVADTTAAAFTDAHTQAVSGEELVVGKDEDGNDVVMTYDDIDVRNDADSATPVLYQAGEGVADGGGDYYVRVDGADYLVTDMITDPDDENYGQVTYDMTAAVDTSDFSMTEVSGAVVSSPEDAVSINVSGLDSEVVGDSPEVYAFKDGSGYVIKGEVEGQTVYFEAEVNNETGVVSIKQDDSGENIQLNADPLASLDAALNQVDSLRSELGAVQNRFEDAITNLNTNETNLAAARSRIEDADYAVEVANMTRAQILQQAGTSVLAQANQVPQNVLSLLG